MRFGLFVHDLLPVILTSGLTSIFGLAVLMPELNRSLWMLICGVFCRHMNLLNIANSLISSSVNSIYPQVT